MNKIELGKILKLQQGYAFKSKNYVEKSKFVLITLANISENNDFKIDWNKSTYYSECEPKNFILHAGDLVMPLTEQSIGLLGNSAFIPNIDNITFLLNQRVAKVEPIDNWNITFIHYLLSSNIVKKQIEWKASSGTKQRNISPNDIYTITTYLPSKDTCNKIGIFFDRLDRKINANKKIIETLSKLTKELYDYWFVQYDFPNKEGKPYKSSGGKMVWNKVLKQYIPVDWGHTNIGKFVASQVAGDWGKENSEKNYVEKVTCIRGTDFQSIVGTKYIEAPTRYILKKNLKEKKLYPGDILIEISGGSPIQSTGRICYINEETLSRFDSDLIVSNFCRCLRLKEKKYIYWFYNTWKRIYDAGVLFGYEGKTTGIKNLLLDTILNNYMLPDFPDKLLQRFHEEVCPIYKKIQSLTKESEKLNQIKMFIHPLLMNGQITIKD